MTDYRHMMGQIALSDKKKGEILDMLENRPTRRRRRLPAAKLVLAAALALVFLLCAAAGMPGLFAYHFANGGSAAMEAYGPHIVCGDDNYRPAEVRDGRLWFTVDGQETDITDLVDEETPYIYTRIDPISGAEGYVVVGGTPENFGWAEFYMVDGTSGAFGMSVNSSEEVLEIDGQTLPRSELTEEQQERVRSERRGAQPGEDPFHGTIVERPWLMAAKERLGIRP